MRSVIISISQTFYPYSFVSQPKCYTIFNHRIYLINDKCKLWYFQQQNFGVFRLLCSCLMRIESLFHCKFIRPFVVSSQNPYLTASCSIERKVTLGLYLCIFTLIFCSSKCEAYLDCLNFGSYNFSLWYLKKKLKMQNTWRHFENCVFQSPEHSYELFIHVCNNWKNCNCFSSITITIYKWG